jgi:hypothetical protein
MKKRINIALMSLLLVGLVLATKNTIVVTGNSQGIEESTAYDEAIVDAKKKAVEEGLRLFLESSSSGAQKGNVLNDLLDNYEDYVISADLLKKGTTGENEYFVRMEIIVDLTKIEIAVRNSADELSRLLGNPTIAFILTTWEIKGEKNRIIIDDNEKLSGNVDYSGSIEESGKADANYDYSGKAELDVKVDTIDGFKGDAQARVSEQASAGYNAKSNLAISESLDASRDYHRDLEVTTINEELWKKVPDLSIIDAFQQEFMEKGFELRASERAREVAMSESIVSTAINPLDRKAVREQAEKDGVNFVARGEVMIMDIRQTGLSLDVRDSLGTESKRPIFSRKTSDVAAGKIEVNYSEEFIATVKIGVEIIDVNSSNIVASYSNTQTALNSNPSLAKSQGIKKCAVLAARTLASQTLTTWQRTAETGSRFSVEFRGVTSVRSQQRPIVTAIEEIGAQMQSVTTPEQGNLLVQCIYKGSKTELGYRLLDHLGVKPGFEEGKFDGPFFEGGLIVFNFLN